MKTFSLMSDPDKKLTLNAYKMMIFDIDFRINTRNFTDETISDLNIKKHRLSELIDSLKSELHDT